MRRVIRLFNVATAFVLIAVTANVSGWSQEYDEPKFVVSKLVAIDDAYNPKGSILAVTPNRTCVLIRVSSKSRTLKNGSPFPFSQIKADTELVCKGTWDTTTSPPSFRALEISVGKRISRSELMSTPTAASSGHPIAYAAVPRQPQVEVSALKCRLDKSRSVVTGKVKNITSASIKSMAVVVRYFTPDGRLLLSETYPLKKNEIKPKESVDFEVVKRWDSDVFPDIGKTKVEFVSNKGSLLQK